jgi:hypothetical protein
VGLLGDATGRPYTQHATTLATRPPPNPKSWVHVCVEKGPSIHTWNESCRLRGLRRSPGSGPPVRLMPGVRPGSKPAEGVSSPPPPPPNPVDHWNGLRYSPPSASSRRSYGSSCPPRPLLLRGGWGFDRQR